jgi:hypothetical protein
VLVASVALFVRPVTDVDFWLHMATGRWIVEHARLPAYDLFTYTVSGHRWVNHEYLSEVLMWLLQARFGLAGVSVVWGLLSWLGLLLVLAACRPRTEPYVVTGLGLALAALAGAPIWGPRPQMVTFVLLALELLWLRRALADDDSRAILWLPAVMALWSNLHGGWPVAFPFLGIAMAVSWRRPALLRRLALVTALSAVAVGLNPNGIAIYAYPFQTLTSVAQQSLIAEWASPNFHLLDLRAFELMVLLLIAGLALSRPSPGSPGNRGGGVRISRGGSAFDLLVALAGLALALESARNVALFVAVATPVLVAVWSDVWRRLPAWPRPAPPRWAPAVAVVALLGVAAAIVPRIAGDLARQPALTAQTQPVGAADWLAANPGIGTRMFNEYAWGGYLAMRFSPRPARRVYILSEGVLVGDAQLERYHAVVTLQPGWRSVLDEDGVDYVVFDSGSALDGELAHDPGWRLAYRDRTAVVYVRAPD